MVTHTEYLNACTTDSNSLYILIQYNNKLQKFNMSANLNFMYKYVVLQMQYINSIINAYYK